MSNSDPRDAKWVQRCWETLSDNVRTEVLTACELPTDWRFRAFVPNDAQLHAMLKG